MRKFHILAFLFICTLPVQTIKAQENFTEVPAADKKAIFMETFAGDSREWKGNGQGIPGKIEAGQLHLDFKGSGTGKSIILHSFQAGMAANFELEARIRMIGGACSFVCSAKSNSDLVTLSITDNNKLILSRKSPGSSKPVIIFTSPANRFNSKEVNRLVWRKTGSRCLFFINDILLGDIPLSMPAIDRIGLECMPESDCWIDDITFSELTGTPPAITWIFPREKSVVNYTGNLLVALCLKSTSKIHRPQVLMNGMPVKDMKEYAEKESDSCSMILECTLELKPGKNNFNVLAGNYAGSSMSPDLQVTYQQGQIPSVVWLESSLLRPNTSLASQRISASISSATEITDAYVQLNDTGRIPGHWKLNEKGQNQYNFDADITLNEGKNSICIVAINKAGPGISDRKTLVYAPVSSVEFRWIRPAASGTETFQSSDTLQVLLKSKEKIKSALVMLNGIPAGESKIAEGKAAGEYLAEWIVQLKEGDNNLNIVASNGENSFMSEDHHITCTPSQAPVVKWISPANKVNETRSDTFEIRILVYSRSGLGEARINLNGKDQPVEKSLVATGTRQDEYQFIRKFPLVAGENTLYVVASNPAGTTTSEKKTVTYLPSDTPVITWILPSSLHAETSQNLVKVSALVRSGEKLKSAAISINGKISEEKFSPVAGKPTEYLVESMLQLKPGVNFINILAKTVTQSTLSPDLQITYSPVSPPAISWESPSEPTIGITSGTARIQLKILSKTELRDIKLLVNDEESPAGTEVRPTNREKGEYTFEKTIQLKQGQNKIRLSAGNLAGDASSDIHTIVWESIAPPVITWISPGSKRSTVNSNIHTLKFEIRTDGELSQLALGMNGARESIDLSRLKKNENGSYQVEKPLQLKAGENSICITATNNRGVSATDSLSIQYNRVVPPSITWVSPAQNSVESPIDKAEVKVIIASSTELQDANIYLNGAAVDDMGILPERTGKDSYSVSRSLSLKQGENILYVIATNAGGSTRSESRTIMNRLSVPPEITWMNPQSNTTVTAESLGIEICIKSPSEIKSAQLFVNGIQQAVDMSLQNSGAPGCAYNWQRPVILQEGDNNVFIVATNEAGSTTSEKRTIRLERAITEKRLALVFGNSAYGEKSLKNPVNDANLIEATLKILGFDVIKRINASKNEMEMAIREFSKRLPDYNVALFYYAGHGIQVDGINYLIPIDAMLSEKTDCKFEAISVNFVVEEFEKYPDNTNIVILDACRDNPFRSWARGGEGGFRAINPTSGTIIAFATSEGAVAADGSGANGLFTEELVKQLVLPQTIEGVFKKTRVQVEMKSRGAQSPQEWSKLKGDFYFKK